MGWENGRQLTSLSKQPPVVITTQPENYYGTVGGTATFTVAASGDRVTYQWQRSINDGETWDNISGGTSTTLSVPIQAGLNGYLYRCIAKDYMGHIATSQAGKLTVSSGLSTISEFEPEFTVINEPDDYYGRPGDTATFIVEAEGENLSYNWLCRAPGANNFEYLTSSDATTNTLRVEMTAASNGAEYRCFIADANGDMGSTRIATVKLDILDWEMEYNTSGIRTKRVSEEKTYNYIYAGDKLMRMTVGNDTLDFNYDVNGVPLTMTYNGTVYYYTTNLQGDVISLERADGGGGAQYAYDAWGNIIAMSGTLAELNPLRYRGYVYDQETGFYYLNSRYYDPAVGRFINADNQLTMGTLAGVNLFTYCGNDPVNRKDPTGEAWYHWAIGAAVVAAAAVATVVTCGGFAAAAAAVCMVGSGVAAATTASTVAAAAFIGSAAIYGAAVLASASCSNSIEEFNAQGNWGTVAATAGGAVFSGAAAYAATRTPTTTVYRSVSNAEAQDIKNTGQFNLAPGGMESKQFGFNLSETRQFGNMIGQNTIVSARVPNSMLSQLYTGGVDTSIFRAGTLTVYGDQLGAFNQAVSRTIKFMQ